MLSRTSQIEKNMFSGLISYGSAIRCYKCTSAFGGACDDPLDISKNSAFECGLSVKSCLKIRTETIGIKTSKPYTSYLEVKFLWKLLVHYIHSYVAATRLCGNSYSSNGCSTLAGVTTCYCDSDSCNSVSEIKTSILTITLAFLAYYWFWRFQRLMTIIKL